MKVILLPALRSIINCFFNILPDILLQNIERQVTRSQGKGFGTSSIRREIEVIYNLLGRDAHLAIDIGGNIGNYASELMRKNNVTEIHIFEPSSLNIQKLEERVSDNDLVKIIPCAVSDQVGNATLFSDVPGSGLGSLTKRKLDHLGINFEFEQSVPTIRFEDYWKKELDSRPIDIVKIDIEGNELLALQGFGAAIKVISVIQFEFGGCNVDTRTYFRDFYNFFKENDFEIFRITPMGMRHIKIYREIDEFFLTTNYVAKNNNN